MDWMTCAIGAGFGFLVGGTVGVLGLSILQLRRELRDHEDDLLEWMERQRAEHEEGLRR